MSVADINAIIDHLGEVIITIYFGLRVVRFVAAMLSGKDEW